MSANTLISALQDPARYDHATGKIKLFETHISWVLLTGDYVYKIKKPLDLGFLDFSSLAQRHRYCQQELELNRRLAPELYLGVVKISGSARHPRINGPGEAIEYAVKMRQFDPDMQFDSLLQRQALTTQHIDALADRIAAFHQGIETAPADSRYGTAPAVWQPMQDNFDQIEQRLQDRADRDRLERLRQWSRQRFDSLQTAISARKRNGFVRNCHGDMHLANIAWVNDAVTIFDCIEFNDEFRWIDVISEIAFTTMDLVDRERPDLAARLLDRYLQHTGDYGGLRLLRLYQVYRALVRAKVAIIRHSQGDISAQESAQALAQYRDYARLAESLTATTPIRLYITHGVSGAGKTTLSQPLLEQFGMIRLRSDVERKRLFGLAAQDESDSDTGAGIYTSSASEHTYARLQALATEVIHAGYNVIVDATFLKRMQRRMFQGLARQLAVPFVILHFHADESLLRRWIRERLAAGQDASEADVQVLEHQLNNQEPLIEGEADHIIAIDSGRDDAAESLLYAVKRLP
ncbi:hypothetical protein Tel_10675 [Candidatus Tenderia electrophaga]|jgi:hypothetical protein|uniref:Aminoglycoside phosphotransferase domain-containing protein n=1 Tax=Candidatus Tenderia electrophaga TaxID=1748243 RepID=A0A0S2TEI5_9GAMM|nr:hypothetical protein Tel_10675 [Candidatus Tenderia electrophaga]